MTISPKAFFRVQLLVVVLLLLACSWCAGACAFERTTSRACREQRLTHAKIVHAHLHKVDKEHFVPHGENLLRARARDCSTVDHELRLLRLLWGDAGSLSLARLEALR